MCLGSKNVKWENIKVEGGGKVTDVRGCELVDKNLSVVECGFGNAGGQQYMGINPEKGHVV